jgi:hypothetical protein
MMTEDDLKKLELGGAITIQMTMRHNGVAWSLAVIVDNPNDKDAETIRNEILQYGGRQLKAMSNIWNQDDPQLRYSTINGVNSEVNKSEVKSEWQKQ